MIAAMLRGSLWLFTFVVGSSIRKRQTISSQFLQHYTKRDRDVLEAMEVDDELRRWAEALNLGPDRRVLTVLNPLESPKLARSVLRGAEQPSTLSIITEQLNRIESSIAGLESHLSSNERGKLRANFEYVLDFSISLTQTLLLAYAGQLEWQRFAVVLEEIELQTSQIMSSLEERLTTAEARFAETSVTKQLLTDFSGELDRYNRDRSHWILAIQVRCSASYLRLSLPKAHQAFIFRQLQRMRQHVVSRQQQFAAADDAIAQTQQSVPSVILNSIQKILGPSGSDASDSGNKPDVRQDSSGSGNPPAGAVGSLAEDKASGYSATCDVILEPVQQLLANPRSSLKEIRRFITDRISIVVHTDNQGAVTRLWRLTKRRWYSKVGSDKRSEPRPC
ncbi:MAG: hypothetical protein Aurels2KO_50260 [Aureliella sp.]